MASQSRRVNTGGVEEGGPRRLFITDARGPERYLRVTWHRETSTVVFSHWQNDVCVASTPVALNDASRLIGLLVDALKDSAFRPAERPDSSPGAARAGGLLSRLRAWLRPQLAQVVTLHDRSHHGPSRRESTGA